jgi:hypothetical protein
MSTTVKVDDSLLEEARRVSDARNEEDLVRRALEEYVDHHRFQEAPLDLPALRDSVGILADYDYKRLRREDA